MVYFYNRAASPSRLHISHMRLGFVHRSESRSDRMKHCATSRINQDPQKRHVTPRIWAGGVPQTSLTIVFFGETLQAEKQEIKFVININHALRKMIINMNIHLLNARSSGGTNARRSTPIRVYRKAIKYKAGARISYTFSRLKREN